MKKLLRRSILLLASVLLLATAVFAGGDRDNPLVDPAEGYYCVKETSYQCDENGNLMSDGNVSTTSYQYEFNADGFVKEKKQITEGSGFSAVYTWTYDYDEKGRVVEETYSYSGADWTDIYQYTYNAEDQITSYAYTRIDQGEVMNSYIIEYTYDRQGSVVKEQYRDTYWNTEPTTAEYAYTYDSKGRVISKETDMETRTYEYEETDDGLTVTEKSSVAGETISRYGQNGRLTEYTISYMWYLDVVYYYDEYGNCVKEFYSFGSDGELNHTICIYEFETFETNSEPDEVVFEDIVVSSSYYNAVLWAVDKGITKGTSATEFSPKADCTRAQIVTFLWRYAGEPEPTTTEHNFVDIVEGSSYYKAVLWAVEKGITNGLDDTHFGPKEPCTRAQIVTFLWRAAGKPQPSSQQHNFTDIVKGSSYYDAVLWAVEKGITTGADTTHFAPKDTCTRAQGMTFLWRYNNTKS